MKKSVYFLVFLFIGTYCFSQDTEPLPEKLWMEIVQLNSSQGRTLKRWETDIKVRLEGDYTQNDSVNISKVLKKLDALTETISVKFSKSQIPNFRIKFLDTTGIGIPLGQNEWSLSSDGSTKGYKSGELNIYKNKQTDETIAYLIEPKIAKLLVSSYFYSSSKRYSIFNPNPSFNNAKKPLNAKDIAIIKEIYKVGFQQRLKKAKNKFGYSLRDQSLWWVKNPLSVLVLPIIISLVLFIFFIKRTNQILALRIKKNVILFGITSLIGLFILGVLIVVFVSFHDFLTIPKIYGFSFVRKNTIIGTAISLSILFPFLYLFRFVELKIQKSSQNIFIKTGLIFLSTGLIPMTCYLIVLIFVFKNPDINIDAVSLFASQIFLLLMSIATIRALIAYFIFKERNLIIENETKLSNLRELKAKAELKSLQSRINPHFLYNSLNSIASLAPIDAEKTQKMAHSLSDLFKYSINRKGKKMSTIKDEIEMVKSYLDIEKIRFGDRLQFNIEVNETLLNHDIPLFLIQPLVENAVKHGISRNEGNGQIILKIEMKANKLNISVSDNGPDFPEGLVSGHGLQTVYDLLRLSYGNQASLHWTNTPEKTITITIPEPV